MIISLEEEGADRCAGQLIACLRFVVSRFTTLSVGTKGTVIIYQLGDGWKILGVGVMKSKLRLMWGNDIVYVTGGHKENFNVYKRVYKWEINKGKVLLNFRCKYLSDFLLSLARDLIQIHTSYYFRICIQSNTLKIK